MKQPSVYLKMRVLGAIDTVHGKDPPRTRPQRRRHDLPRRGRQPTPVHLAHHPDLALPLQKPRHHRHDQPRPRKDKGHARKVTPEELLEAINAAKPHFHNQRTNKRAIYRFCVEKGLLHPDRIAQTTFYRFIREYDLLAPDDSDDNKKRLAFSMKYANQLWQADTMFGPYCDAGVSPGSRKQAKLIAFIDDASRVLCHGEFFFEENVDTLVQGHPRRLLQTRRPRTTPRR